MKKKLSKARPSNYGLMRAACPFIYSVVEVTWDLPSSSKIEPSRGRVMIPGPLDQCLIFARKVSLMLTSIVISKSPIPQTFVTSMARK